MPIENWYPISSDVHDLPAGMDDWSAGGSTSVNKNANTRVGGGRSGPATHDDDVSYTSRAWIAGTEEQSLNIDWPSPMISVQASTTFHANGRHRVSGSTRRLARFTNPAGTHGTAWLDVTDSTVAYANTGPVDVSTAATYRPGGGSWALADFDDDTSLFVTLQITSGQAVFTSVWGDIEFTAPGGALIFLLGLAGWSALQFVGPLQSFREFTRFLEWRREHHPRHTVLTAEETREAWCELQAYRWPRYYFPKLA